MVGLEDGFDVFCGLIVMCIHHGFDNLRNLRQTDSFVDKSTDRFLVRGVHRRRQRATFTQGSIRESYTRKTIEIRRLQSEDRKSQSDPTAATGMSAARDTSARTESHGAYP